jgi:hypothetical protein
MEGDTAAPTDVNNDNKFEILNTSSQPNVSKTRSSNKRSNPDSPDTLPATQKQTLRQIRRKKRLKTTNKRYVNNSSKSTH